MNWIQANWEHVLAGLGALSILLHALEAGCANAGWTKYEGIFSQLVKFIQGFLGGVKPPTAGGGAVAVIIVALMASCAHADPVSVGDVLKNMGAKTGVIYCWHTNQAIATNNATIASFKMVDLSAGVARADGLDAAISVDVSKLNIPILKLPVLNYLNYANVGFGCAKFNGDRHYPCGGYVSASWKF